MTSECLRCGLLVAVGANGRPRRHNRAPGTPCVARVMHRLPNPPKTIHVQPDFPALLAKRLVDRLREDCLLFPAHPLNSSQARRVHVDQVTEALADEIHKSLLEGLHRASGGAT